MTKDKIKRAKQYKAWYLKNKEHKKEQFRKN